MSDLSVTVDGIEALQAKLNRVANVGATLRTPFAQTAADIKTHMKEYPPSTEANMPRPGHTYYKRGYGPIYVRVRDGGVTGRKTSQLLNKSWSTSSQFTANTAKVTIGSRATYARYVHWGPKQARFHKARGWRTVQDAAKKYAAVLVKRATAAIDAALAR